MPEAIVLWVFLDGLFILVPASLLAAILTCYKQLFAVLLASNIHTAVLIWKLAKHATLAPTVNCIHIQYNNYPDQWDYNSCYIYLYRLVRLAIQFRNRIDIRYLTEHLLYGPV